VNRRPDVGLGDIDGQVGVLGGLVRVVDAGEALNLARARLGVDAALVCLLAVLEGRGDVDEVEGAVLLDEVLGGLAAALEGGDGGGDDGGARLGQLRGDEGDAPDVGVAVGAAEAQLGGELGADCVAEEQRDGAAALLVECHVEGARDGVLARVLVARQEDGEALLGARRVRLAQHADDLGVGEPLRDVGAGAQALAQLGAGDVEGLDALGDLVLGLVLVGIGQVGHHLEGHDLDAELVLVLLDGLLCVVGAVELLALGVLTGPGVVATDDEVCGTEVLADDGVPDGLAGTAHAHGKGQQGQGGHAVGVAGQQGLVDADAGEVVDVAGLGQADDGVDEHVGLAGAGSADGQLAVSAVHGVACLEGDDLGPAQLVEVRAQLRGGEAQADVVVVLQAVDGLELTADVVLLDALVEVLDGRVLGVAAEDLLGLLGLVGLVYIVDGDDGEVAVVAEVAQGYTCAGLDAQRVDHLLGHVQRDGHGEDVAIDQALRLDHALVVLLVEETCVVLSVLVLVLDIRPILSRRRRAQRQCCPSTPPTTTTTTTKELVSADSAPSLRPSIQVPTRQKPAPWYFAPECERTLKRREASVQDQLQIAQLPLSEDDGRQALSLCEKFLAAGGIARNQVLEDAACCLVSSCSYLRRRGYVQQVLP
jgi:hypothetical protein